MVFLLPKVVSPILFHELVRVSSGFNVIPIDTTNELDEELISTLSNILSKFLKTLTATKSRLQGNRDNEVGRRIEELSVNELNKQAVPSS